MSEINWFKMPETEPSPGLLARIADRLEQDRNMLRESVEGMSLPCQLMGRMDQAMARVPDQIHAQVSLALQHRPDLSVGARSQIDLIAQDLVAANEALRAVDTMPAFVGLKQLSAQALDIGELRSQLDAGLNGLRDLEAASSGSIRDFAATRAEVFSTLSNARDQLLQVQTQTMGEVAQEAMAEIGYATVSQQKNQRVMVRGVKDGNAFVAELEEGRMVLDAIAADGVSCRKETWKLRQALADRGIDLVLQKTRYLGPRPGELKNCDPQGQNQVEGFNPLRQRSKNRSKMQKMAAQKRQRG